MTCPPHAAASLARTPEEITRANKNAADVRDREALRPPTGPHDDLMTSLTDSGELSDAEARTMLDRYTAAITAQRDAAMLEAARWRAAASGPFGPRKKTPESERAVLAWLGGHPTATRVPTLAMFDILVAADWRP